MAQLGGLAYCSTESGCHATVSHMLEHSGSQRKTAVLRAL